jgi:flagellar hook-associated protein 2
LARAHQIGSQGFSDETNSIPQGEISFQVGDRPAATVTIDETNNTVEGLVEAINSQSSDVSASIVYDQANSANRVLLTSKLTGAANEIEVTNNLAVAAGNEVRPDFGGVAIQEASNATIQLGSGSGALVAEYESNSVDGLIDGVTLNLRSADADKEITVNVARDTETAQDAIETFVDRYNSLIGFIDAQTSYNPETNEGSPLLGNRNVSNLKNSLSSIVTEAVPGLGGGLNRLSQIGIDIDSQGRLAINASELTQALEGDVEGIDPSEIGRLFGLSGESDNAGVEFLLGSSDTLESTSGYQVDISQAAERGSVTATSLLASSIVIDGSNNQFEFALDGLESQTIELGAGTYTPQELADHLEARINNSPDLKGAEVSVSLEGGSLQLTSQRYGSDSKIENLAGSALASLGFDGSESGVGKDVVGSFIVDGVVETATGSGRLLIGDAENENTADLQLRVTLDASQVGVGVESTVTVSRGITSKLDQYFDEITEDEIGTMAVVNENFDLRIDSIQSSIARVNAISDAKTQYLIEQFTVLERTLSDLQSTSSFLTSQLA